MKIMIKQILYYIDLVKLFVLMAFVSQSAIFQNLMMYFNVLIM